jgi:hypothetical protein
MIVVKMTNKCKISNIKSKKQAKACYRKLNKKSLGYDKKIFKLEDKREKVERIIKKIMEKYP